MLLMFGSKSSYLVVFCSLRTLTSIRQSLFFNKKNLFNNEASLVTMFSEVKEYPYHVLLPFFFSHYCSYSSCDAPSNLTTFHKSCVSFTLPSLVHCFLCCGYEKKWKTTSYKRVRSLDSIVLVSCNSSAVRLVT